MSRLVKALTQVLAALRQHGVRHAAIGGLAVVAHGIVRATGDLDFLVDAACAEPLRRAMSSLGFRCIYQSADIANYVSHDLRVDFVLAHRPLALALLESPARRSVFEHELPVVDVEGIVGLKLQAIANDARRVQDLTDIRALLSRHRETLDMGRLRVYFELFDRLDLLDELMRESQPHGT